MTDGGRTERDVPGLLPARMLNEYSYCPRLFYLEWVQGEFRDSADTVEGRMRHSNVDAESRTTPPPPDADPDGEPQVVRSLTLGSDALGLIARVDLVEFDGGRAVPVDYKRGAVPDGGPWEPERVQICVQALLLRDEGYSCDEGVLYFASSRKRVRVAIDEELVARTREMVAAARSAAANGVLPPPLVDSPKCPRCSLAGICLPDEVNALVRDRRSSEPVRRLFPARDNARPLLVQDQGSTVGKKGDRLIVRSRSAPDGSKETREVRLLDVSELCVFGGVQVTSPALRAVVGRGATVSYFTYGGWFEAIATGMNHKNVELRIAQYRVAGDAARSLDIARAIVAGKIRNQRTLLRRNHDSPPKEALDEMERLARSVRRAADAGTLMGVEGAAARVYFANFSGMVRGAATFGEFDFHHRNRRPPRDPVNALLSFAYSLLTKDLNVQALRVGLDPLLGFFHRPRYGRPALALDLAEEFRAILGDSTVISAINNGEVRPSDFVKRGNAVALNPRGRKKFLAAYERRIDTLIKHPVLGYSASYRRIMEVQTRLLSRHLLGELETYRPFRTR